MKYQVIIQDNFNNLYHIGFYKKLEYSIKDVNKFIRQWNVKVDEIKIKDTIDGQCFDTEIDIDDGETIWIRGFIHDETFTPRQYLEMINIKTELNDDEITSNVLAEILTHEDVCLWDYPIEEIEYCTKENIPVILVEFPDGERRLCEIYEKTKL